MNYSKLLQGILDIAEEMLVAGAEVSRVEDSIERMCSAYGCTRVNAFIITSNIQVTMEDPEGKIITQIRRIVRSDINFDKLDYLNDLSRYICANRPDVSELRQKFEKVMSRKTYPIWVNWLGSMIVAGGFAVFFGGTLRDGVASALVGLAITVSDHLLAKIENNQMARLFTVSFGAGIISLLTVYLHIGINSDKIMIGAIMLLIPGIAMTNSVRDMLIGDIATGMLRLANAIMLAAAIACGFALSLLLMGGGTL